ncbi:hypothetical protein E0765_06055 [Sulfuricurvum sp. IAE1]|uniref:hypothetical protein n=1 Tax=Sulfuricurvum sp. IAE1 TaxID=2546102 RepID=UPI0010508EE3|nr:hypothetical protein [Sulfuricurvum sp. IAE1]TDA64275.1 hypothetical protein E0765_06055 [Sulfuricurvum sp. IAE1]
MKIMYPSNISIVSSNVSGSLLNEWDINTPYSIGAQVYLPDNYGEYKALTNNTGKKPNENPLDWEHIGTANKFKMFDQFLNTQTINPENIDVEVVAYGSKGMFIGNIEASSVLIEVIDNDTLQTIESTTFDMVDDVVDWLDYFFGDWLDQRKNSVTYYRTTLTMNITYHVKIDNGVSEARCGILFIGVVREIGATKYSFSLGALDFSKVVTNQSSGATLLERGNYAKTIRANVFARTGTSQMVFKRLTEARGTPLVFLNGGGLLDIFGYIQKHEVLIEGPVETAITVDIIGLI